MKRMFNSDVENFLTEQDVDEMIEMIKEEDLNGELGIELGLAPESWHDLEEDQLPTPEKMYEDDVEELEF